jgi:hypothetical protein
MTNERTLLTALLAVAIPALALQACGGPEFSNSDEQDAAASAPVGGGGGGAGGGARGGAGGTTTGGGAGGAPQAGAPGGAGGGAGGPGARPAFDGGVPWFPEGGFPACFPDAPCTTSCTTPCAPGVTAACTCTNGRLSCGGCQLPDGGAFTPTRPPTCPPSPQGAACTAQQGLPICQIASDAAFAGACFCTAGKWDCPSFGPPGGAMPRPPGVDARPR